MRDRYLAAKTVDLLTHRRPPRRSAIVTFATAVSGAAITFGLMRPHETSRAAELLARQEDLSGRDVTVQLFQWPHADVENECVDYLGPAGYRWAQVSPPQETVQGPQWWTDYQPVSYDLRSKRGDEAAFARMVRRCKDAGVGIIVDTVINHMSGAKGGIGTGGHRFKHYEYPGLYGHGNFHHCGRNGNDHIGNYHDRWEVQNCELLGLADLATGQSRVQHVLAGYLTRLLDLGVDGFRVDAAKHVPARDIAEVFKKVRAPLGSGSEWRARSRQEVWFNGGEPIRPEEYVRNGRVHVFQGAYDLKRMFLSDGAAYLASPVPWGEGWGDGYLPSASSQTFVSNHDLERADLGLRWTSQNASYLLAHVFLLTWGYGRPDVFSGYDYRGFDDGPKSSRVVCGRDGWRCEHRHPVIAGSVTLRRAAGSLPRLVVETQGKDRMVFTRGKKVVVAINNSGSTWKELVVGSGLPEGWYCNMLLPPAQRRREMVHVRGPSGLVRLDVPSHSAVGLMVGGVC